MYSRKQFAALEAMSREQAALAKTEMEHSLMEYWLAEAEEWKQLRQSTPFKGRIPNCSSDLAESNSTLTPMTRDRRRLLEHRGSARCEQLGGFYRAEEELEHKIFVASYPASPN